MTGAEWRAVYRLQLSPEFGFRDALAVVPYLRDLGVSHLYLSPSLQAAPGSMHGYDVVDPTRIDAERGGEEAFRELASAGLGVLLDVVPNHMATDDENPFWRDPELRRRFFDWDPETGWHRRFFDVDRLAGVRVEDEEVFRVTHAKVLELVRDGSVDGLRIDHPDGLADPRGYLERLAAEGVEHVWVEKILEPGEHLRAWPVEGTTGYEFANDVTALFVDPRGEAPLTALYAELTGERRPFAEVADEAKLEQAETTFRPELEGLRRLHDHPGLAEAAASLHVYRTYVEPWSGRVEPDDRAALATLPHDDLRRGLLLEDDAVPGEFVTRFQQTTGPVMAKGVEDTAFYRWFRLTALNEVGGDPGRFSLPVEEFHRANLERAARFPRHLLATTTHDTKRSGDVRARIAALASVPEQWADLARTRVAAFDDPNEGYLALQTVVGAWPLSADRLRAYLEKALREGKRSTNWLEPDTAHERRVQDAAVALLSDPEVERFALHLAEAGRRIALGMTLLKLTAPGVPDVYWGDELELLALVDPDNRRPVDWELRRRLLGSPDEPPKLTVVREALALRARRPEAFAGSYEPVEAGPDVCAFGRGGEVLVVVPLRPGASKDAVDAGGARDLLDELPVGLFERDS